MARRYSRRTRQLLDIVDRNHPFVLRSAEQREALAEELQEWVRNSYGTAYSRDTYRMRRDAGLCVRCKKEAIPGRSMCGYHQEEVNERQTANNRRKRKIAKARLSQLPQPGALSSGSSTGDLA